MADEKLRQLERRWKQTGCAEETSAYLAERYRQDDVDWSCYRQPLAAGLALRWLRGQLEAESISREDLALAAYCGDPVAQQCAEAPPEGPPAELTEWVQGLARFRGGERAPSGLICELRAPIAALRPLLERAPDPPAERVLEHVEAFVLTPTQEIAARALQTGKLGSADSWIPADAGPLLVAALFAAQAASHIARYAQILTTHPTAPLLVGYRGASVFKPLLQEQTASSAELRASVAAELIPWALGFADPVRTRVEARMLRAACDREGQ